MTDIEPSPRDRYQLYSPETWDVVYPLDEYNETHIKFLALRDMGYPVVLELVHRDDVPADIIETSSGAYPESVGNEHWVRPVVMEPDFEEWIESFSAPGTMIRVGGEIQDYLKNHPVVLLEQVDNHCFEDITEALRKFSKQNGQPMYPIVDEEFLERCLIAAFERFTESPHVANRVVGRYAHERYERAVAKKLQAISPMQLGQLVKDYYGMVELLCPEITRFKGASPSPPEYEI